MTGCRPEVRHGPFVAGLPSRVHRRGPAVAIVVRSARSYGVSRTPAASRSPRGTAAA